MQTFLPSSEFSVSARILDRKRLGKQRVEVLQILQALAGNSTAWKNHPAVKMWQGYETALVRYGLAICREWVRRGYEDNCAKQIRLLSKRFSKKLRLPKWLGDFDFHASHRSNLLRKKPEYYRKFNWLEEPNLEYVWPNGRKECK